MTAAVIVTEEQVDQALDQVEKAGMLETANLLRNFIRGILALLRVYEAGDDQSLD